MQKIRLVSRPDHPSLVGTGQSSHPGVTGGSTFWPSCFPGRYFRFPAGAEIPGPGFEELIISSTVAELATGKWSLELVFSELLRLGARPGRVGSLAALAPEAAQWLLQNLSGSEKEWRHKSEFSSEDYAASARSSIARAVAMSVLDEIEK